MTPSGEERTAQRLPAGARTLVGALAAGALLVGALVWWLDTGTFSPIATAVLAVAIVGGEAFKVDLPFRRAGNARYGLGDLSLTAGLLLLGGGEVLVAAAAAAVGSAIIDRSRLVRAAFNVPQYVLAAGVAALTMELLAPAASTELSVWVFGVAVLAVTLFTLCNVLSVSGIITLTSREPWVAGIRRIAPVALIIALGNAALGLLAVVVIQTLPWALPALGVPLVLMYAASRQEVRAKIDRERSDVYVAVEQRLADTVEPDLVARTLAEGTADILGCNAAIWRDGRWIGEVPDGSTDCPVDPNLEVPLVALGPGLGPATGGRCVAIGLGGGILVVWEGDLGIGPETEDWLDRLARSGRAHFERAAAASALAQEQATLRAVVAGTRDGICVLDTNGTIRLWNPAMAQLSAVPAEDAVGAAATSVLGDGPWTADGVHDVVRDDGERVWRLSVSGIRDDRHGALRVAVVHDVTAERRVARMKDDMLAVVSHELRTPLTPIKASAQLLRRRWERMGDEDRDTLLERIEERADHLSRLVADILLVGQLSASARPVLEIEPTTTDLSAVVRELVAAQQGAHRDHAIGLTAPDTIPATTDPVRVRQVLENIVDNACKFSPPGSGVEVTLTAADGQATVEVADRGRGIPREDLERIFERFERVEDPLVMTTSGAGLGLYIVQELVTALGGRVAIDSTLGAGTTMTVELPLASPARPRALAGHGSGA